MEKERRVVEFYVLCNKLKDVVRTGWKNWNVRKERLESVAEHIYGVQMLAIAMYSEFNYDIDIKKVIMMLSVHELEEIIIGDLTFHQISREEKAKIGHEAVEKILSNLTNKDEIKSLIMEFDERKTKEAQFAYYCDKLECDIQCKLYDEENFVDLTNQKDNDAMSDSDVKKCLQEKMSWSEMWLTFGQKRYNYDENFLKVSEYAKNEKISKK